MSRTALALLLVLVPAAARAQAPTVRVRAEARIELRVERGAGGIVASGTLRDDLGEPLPERRVAIDLQSSAGGPSVVRSTQTDGAGSFSEHFAVEGGVYRVRARWDGDEGHRSVEAAQPLDTALAHVRLTVALGAGGRLDLDRAVHRAEVRAFSDEGGGGLAIEVSSELERLIARGHTDASGRVTLSLASADLGPPAAGRLIVRTPGDERRAPAQTEVPLVRLRPSRIELEASRARIADGESVEVSGLLSDSAGPLPRRAVGLFAAESHLATVLTDDAGRFARTITPMSVDGAPVSLVARYVSDAPWRPGAESPRLTIVVDATGSTPWPWLLAPVALCALGMAWLSRRGRRPARAPVLGGTLPDPPGISTSRPTALGAQRRDVSGKVLDVDDATAICGARVRLTRDGGEAIELSTDDRGEFVVAELDGDAWRLEVVAEGYESRDAAVRVPHRGQFSGVTVRLRTLRQVALAQYRPVADALAPERKWWAFWTPRELSQRAEPALRGEIEALTSAVERAAFAEPRPTQAEVDEISRRSERAARALDER